MKWYIMWYKQLEEWDKHKKACHIDTAGSPTVDFDKEQEYKSKEERKSG